MKNIVRAMALIGLFLLCGFWDIRNEAVAQKAQASPSTLGYNVKVVRDPSVYVSSAEITWDVPEGMVPVGYIIYVNGSERYQSDTNRFTLTELAPDTVYEVSVRAFDDSGFHYAASNPVTIVTTYKNKLTVGPQCDYEDIQTAINAAKPGDVIVVKDGYYTGALTIKAAYSGTANEWITLKAEGQNAWIFGNMTCDASYYRMEGLKWYSYRELAESEGLRPNEVGTDIIALEEKRYILFQSGVGGIKLSGNYIQAEYLEFRDAYTAGFGLGGSHNYLAHSLFLNCRTGGTVSGSFNLLDKNRIEGLAKYALLCGSGDIDVMRAFGHYNTIRNNVVKTLYKENIGNSHVDFVQAYDNNRDDSKHIVIEGNYVDCFHHQGLMLSNMFYPNEPHLDDWIFRNNVLKGFEAWGICQRAEGGLPNIMIENNLFIGGNGDHQVNYGPFISGVNAGGTMRNNIIMNCNIPYGVTSNAICENNLIFNCNRIPKNETNIVGIDPMFVDPSSGDYRLQKGSPAIDAGVPIPFDSDIAGKARWVGGAVDIGPYEYYEETEENILQAMRFVQNRKVLGIGDVYQPKLLVFPENAINKSITYESSNPAVAAVNASGVVTALKGGIAVITARDAVSQICVSCKVDVLNLSDFRGVRIDPDVLIFSVDVEHYAVDVPYDTETMSITPIYVKGAVYVNGARVVSEHSAQPIPLALGKNVIRLVYEDEEGDTTNYTIEVTRSNFKIFDAYADFSDVQGNNQWYYYYEYKKNETQEYRPLIWCMNFWGYRRHSIYETRIGQDYVATDPYIPVLIWKAPQDGVISVEGSPYRRGEDESQENLIATIMRNDEVLWELDQSQNEGRISHDLSLVVKEGDEIRFICSNVSGRQRFEEIVWRPTITMQMDWQSQFGDVNVDGVVNVTDLTFISQHIGTIKTGSDEAFDWSSIKKADVNADQKVDILDLVTVGKLVKTQ